MNKTIDISAEEAKASLLAAEGGMDMTIASLSATIMRLAADRSGAGVDAVRTQRALEEGSQLVLDLVGGRRQLLRYHARLARTAIACGVSATAIGPTDKPDDGTAPPPPGFAPGGTGIGHDQLAMAN